jgi:hypothetical protein
MKTQAWGWLAAGVLALGLNGMYQDGGGAWAHRIIERVADRSATFGDMASDRVGRLMEGASLVAVREQSTSCRLSTAMARVQTTMARTQTGMAHFEAMSAQQEAALERMEVQRARVEARVQIANRMFSPVMVRVEKVPTACARVRVSVPRMPKVRIPAQAVWVNLSGDGPI